MTERTVETDDGDLFVRVEGDGPPLLLVHAYPLSGELWRHQVETFAATRRVIIPDLRGFGRSAVTPGEVSMRRHADDLASVLDAVGVVEPVAYCGVSMAGYVGWQFAERYGDRVAGLFMSSTKARADSGAAVAKRRKIAAAIEAEGIAAAQGVADALIGPSSKPRLPTLRDELREIIGGNDPRGVVAAQHGMAARPDMTDFVRSFGKPLHFVAGTEDAFTTAEEIRELSRSVGAGFTAVEGAGHLVPIERPEDYNAALRAFLREFG